MSFIKDDRCQTAPDPWRVLRDHCGTLLTAIFISLASAVPAGADMGAITPVSDVRLSEPGQKAIILFNGGEEVLILATDLVATGPTPVLRFIPFPAQPEAGEAPQGCFDQVRKLVGK